MAGRSGYSRATRIALISAAVTAAAVLSACSHAGNAGSGVLPAHTSGALQSRAAPPTPVASAVAAPPAATPAPCPSNGGGTGNLSTAPPNLAAWLTAAQMPDEAVYHWSAQGQPVAQPFVQDDWNQLYGVGVGGFLAWQLENYRGSANGEFAGQTIYLYASEAEASCAYQSAVAGAAGNQAASRGIQAQYHIAPDAVTAEIAGGEHDSAWTESWTGPSIPPVTHGPQTDVEYMAQVGTAVTFVSYVLPGLNDSVPDSAAAQAILSEITQHLTVYSSGS